MRVFYFTIATLFFFACPKEALSQDEHQYDDVFTSIKANGTNGSHEEFWKSASEVSKIIIDSNYYDGFLLEDTVIGDMNPYSRIYLYTKENKDTILAHILVPNFIYGSNQRVGMFGEEYHFLKDGYWTFIRKGFNGKTHIAFVKYNIYDSNDYLRTEKRITCYAPCDFDTNDSATVERAYYHPHVLDQIDRIRLDTTLWPSIRLPGDSEDYYDFSGRADLSKCDTFFYDYPNNNPSSTFRRPVPWCGDFRVVNLDTLILLSYVPALPPVLYRITGGGARSNRVIRPEATWQQTELMIDMFKTGDTIVSTFVANWQLKEGNGDDMVTHPETGRLVKRNTVPHFTLVRHERKKKLAK
jgi:hypothetical protein